MTEFELATLRLQAFGLLEGWGVTNSRGDRVPNNMDQQKVLAEELVEWATKTEAKE